MWSNGRSKERIPVLVSWTECQDVQDLEIRRAAGLAGTGGTWTSAKLGVQSAKWKATRMKREPAAEMTVPTVGWFARGLVRETRGR